MGHRALRQVCLNELWGTSHPVSPPILAKPWSSVDLGFTSFCAFYEEIELGKPAWDETYRKAGKVCLLGEEVLRSCIWGSVWLCRWKRTGFRARRWALASWKPASPSTALTSTSTFIYRTALSMGLPGDSDGKWGPSEKLLYKCWCAIQGTQQNASSEGKGWELNKPVLQIPYRALWGSLQETGEGSRWAWLILLVFREHFRIF